MVVLASIIYIERLLHIFMVKLNNKSPSPLNPLLCMKRRVRKGCGQWEYICFSIDHWELFNIGLCHLILMASFYLFLTTFLYSEVTRCSMLFCSLSDPVLESVKFSIKVWFILLEISIWSIGFYSLNHLWYTHIHTHTYANTMSWKHIHIYVCFVSSSLYKCAYLYMRFIYTQTYCIDTGYIL